MSVPDARPAPLRPLAGLPGVPAGDVCGPDGCDPFAPPADVPDDPTGSDETAGVPPVTGSRPAASRA